MHEVAIIIVVITTVVFRPYVSPKYPKMRAPSGLKIEVAHKAAIGEIA